MAGAGIVGFAQDVGNEGGLHIAGLPK
jgi:hypothetical protein